MYISGEISLAVRGKKSDLKSMLQIINDWQEDPEIAEEFNLFEEFCYDLQYHLEPPDDIDELDEAELSEHTLWQAPDDTVTVFASDCVDFEPFVMQCLEAVAETLPDLDIAVIASLDYSVCGGALYTLYSPAGTATLHPKDWDGDWFPLGSSIADWENSVSEAGEIEFDFPEDADWIPAWWLSVNDWDDSDEDNEEEEEE